MDYVDLELAIQRRDIENYSLELRFSQPGDNADVRLLRDDLAAVRFPFSELLTLAPDPLAYGNALTASLFADPAVRQAFAEACAVAQSQGFALRIRLFLAQSALELHSLRWETLCHPEDNTPLLTRPDMLFSRYLSSRDWRPVRARSRGSLRALAVIANPHDLPAYQLVPIEVETFRRQIAHTFGDVPLEQLTAAGEATLDNIVVRLLGGIDILYIVCHAALVNGETWLFLENARGEVERIASTTLVARLRDLAQRPRLVVLAACQTAGSGEVGAAGADTALVALGPRLAEAGIPAVLAMNGLITPGTVEAFMPAFFSELLREGQVDGAMAVARGVVRDRPDSWMPVLFMRLKNGQIWYAPAFADERPGKDKRGRAAEKWPVIVQNIRSRTCTPIIGPDMAESMFGTRQDMAWRLANEHNYPMDPHDREGLPQVAQFLSVNLSPSFLPSSLVRYLMQGIRDRDDTVPATIDQLALDENATPEELIRALDQLITLAWHQRRARVGADPYGVLASLSLPVYITTDQSNLLATALREAGKEPQICLCPWNEDVLLRPELVKVASEPDAQHPLVYHLFGNLQEPDSLVLTEDDFFDYLIGVTRNNEQIPLIVRDRLTDSSLLFLGFRMEDWYFRVFFRTLMDTLSFKRRRRHAHVAVQLAPEEDRLIDPRRARRYLEEYFQHADISIYWGSAEDFAQEFEQHWKRGRP